VNQKVAQEEKDKDGKACDTVCQEPEIDKTMTEEKKSASWT
jgi:hypothetical protein